MFSRQQGFTLIELMVTITVLAIVLVAATPSFASIINGNRLSAAANETMAVLQEARMEAMRSNRRTVACLSANPNAASPSCGTANATGWIVFTDANHDGSFGAGDSLLRVASLSSKVQMLGSSSFGIGVSFRSDGFARLASGTLVNATVGLCVPTSQPAQNVRLVSIGSGSRLSIQKGSTPDSCATPNDKP
ncbi:GspH/FimT family pseudopilin [Lysobacter fragariae]